MCRVTCVLLKVLNIIRNDSLDTLKLDSLLEVLAKRYWHRVHNFFCAHEIQLSIVFCRQNAAVGAHQVGSYIRIEYNGGLERLEMPALDHAGGRVQVNNNDALERYQ